VLFAQWLRLKGLVFTHIPNETFTKSWNQKRKNQREGVAAGVPDYLILTKKGIVFIEMKRIAKSRVSDEQKAWIEAINSTPGAQAEVCYGFAQAREFTEKFI
jgi:hypothetical protein